MHFPTLPPEGLWISPTGRRIPVVEHLLAIQQYPELFDVDVSRHADVRELRDVAETMIRRGWVRFRYLSGTYAFEVDKARDRMGLIADVLASARALSFETVLISQVTPVRDFEGTVDDVYNHTILGSQANPAKNGWRFTRSRSR